MINYVSANFDEIAVHKIGSKSENDGVRYSYNPIGIEDSDLHGILCSYFFKHFKTPSYYALTFSNDELALNPVYHYATQLFTQEKSLHETSKSIAAHLYEISNHPNIKPGELMVCHVRDVLIDDELVDALVIIKSESKDDFLKVIDGHKQYNLAHDQGIFIDKIDKACIILNTEKDDGYKVCILDKSNTQSEALYWKQQFLNAKERDDDYHKTKDYIQATKQFIKDRLNPIYEMDKTDEAAILNRSKAFFQTEETFDSEKYAVEVFQKEEVAELFDEYKGDLQSERDIKFADEFSVSNAAVKNYSKVFKSVIKLDRNFHIYVHGDRDLIERGTDPNGRKYYKIYYEDEK